MSTHKTTQIRTDGEEPGYGLLTRLELARRWKVSIETLKRRERTKILRPVRLDGRIIRYRMSDVLRIEEEGYDGERDE